MLARSEEHTSELQSQSNLVCRLLLEKKKKKPHKAHRPPWRRLRLWPTTALVRSRHLSPPTPSLTSGRVPSDVSHLRHTRAQAGSRHLWVARAVPYQHTARLVVHPRHPVCDACQPARRYGNHVSMSPLLVRLLAVSKTAAYVVFFFFF